MMEGYDYIEQSLIDAPQLLSDVDYERRLNHQRRRLRKQTQSIKNSRRESEKAQNTLKQHITTAQKHRQESLLKGIKFKTQLQKLSEVQQVSTILLMQRELRRRKDMQQLQRKRGQYYTQRQNSVKMSEFSVRAHLERQMRQREKSLMLQKQLQQTKVKQFEENMDKKRDSYLRRREEQSRLRQKRGNIEQFKLDRAQNNYSRKVEELLDKQKEQELLIQQLYARQLQHQQLLKKTQRVGRSSDIVNKLLTGSNFQLTTI